MGDGDFDCPEDRLHGAVAQRVQPSGIGRRAGARGRDQHSSRGFVFRWILISSTSVDAVVGEGHDAFVGEARDPDEAVLGLHFDGDVEEEVDVLAEVFGDSVDGPDAGDLVDVRGSPVQGSSSSSRCAGWPAIVRGRRRATPADRRHSSWQ